MSEAKSLLLGEGSLWETIREVAESEGVELFDLDLPSERGGSLRVYITKHGVKEGQPASSSSEGPEGASSEGRGGVSFEDCVRVSKRLLDMDEESAFIPENCLLEVSSPGINRRLRRPEHFSGAVGERAKIKYRVPETKSVRVVTGMVLSVAGGALELKSDEKGEVVSVPLAEIKEAKIDFQF